MCMLQLWFAATLLLVMSAPVFAAPRDELEAAARAFDDSALRIGDSRPAPFIRWTGPIFYAARNTNASPELAVALRRTTGELAGLAGLGVTDVALSDGRLNYTADFSDNESASGVRTCHAYWQFAKGAITRVIVTVNFANIRRMERCLVHETMHAMGFRSHPHSSDSVLSYTYAGNRSLTRIDRMLIAVLYDKRLAANLPVAAASRQACRLLAEHVGASAADFAAVCETRNGPASN
jgi:hypothetical protein